MKRVITLVLALLMVAALFAGCSNDNNTPADTTTPASKDTTTPAPQDTTTEKPQDTTTPKAEDTTTEKPKDTTTEAPKVEIPAIPEGTMVYFENFDSYADTADSAAVAQLLGWQIRNIADGALTDNTTKYSIESGALKLVNYDGGNIDGKDSYIQITTNEYMAAACQGDYTIQYDIKYTATKTNDRYIVLVANYDGYNSYNTCHLRVYGSANNQPRFLGAWYAYDLKGSDFYSADQDDSDGTTSVLKKLTGQDFDKNVPALLDKSITIRYQANYNEGPTVYMRDNSQPGAEFVCVSKPDISASGTYYWNALEAYALCLKTGAAIDGYVDNIAVWTGLGDMPADTSTTAYTTAIADYLAKVQ